MKPILLFAVCAGFTSATFAQTYSPITVSGYNLDAVAESSPATGSTSGSIDGSDYVLYSYAYGSVFGTGYGLPDNGTITNGLRTYQMNAFSANNTSFIPMGLKDSLTLTTPNSFAALSLLGLATEGLAGMNITVRFTDGSSQVFNGLTMTDWFNNTNAVISGFDRTGRSMNSPDYQFNEPSMYPTDLVLSCANRAKNVQRIIIQNTSTNPRICIFAVSGVALPTYSTTTINATCTAGGSATITPIGGLPAFTYTWTTSPVQNTGIANNLPAGTYTATIKDAATCTNTVTAVINAPTPGSTTVSASSTSLCAGGTVTLTTSGATTYTWSNSASTATAVITPTATGVYSVTGTTSLSCNVTGSINITVYQLPVINFVLSQTTFCSSSPSVTLNATPAGGTYSGAGVAGTSFSPATAGVGTHTLSYMYTNANNCSSTATVTSIVNACTGIEELQSVSCILFPNPNKGSFTLKATSAMQLNIINEIGQPVRLIELNATNNNTIHVENLSQGIYFIIGQNGRESIKQKIVVLN